MVDVTALATPIGNLLQNIFGGQMVLLGIMVLVVFIAFIVFKGGDLITFAPILVPLIIVLAADNVGLLPQWLIIPVLIALVFIVYLALKQAFPN